VYRDAPGIGLGIGQGFQPSLEFRGYNPVRGFIGPRQAGRRHFGGAQFPRDFLPSVRMIADAVNIHAVEHKARCLQLCVVAANAILLNHLRDCCMGF
jgi:hypothetical protein